MHAISFSHRIFMPIPKSHQKDEGCTLSLFKTRLPLTYKQGWHIGLPIYRLSQYSGLFKYIGYRYRLKLGPIKYRAMKISVWTNIGYRISAKSNRFAIPAYK